MAVDDWRSGEREGGEAIGERGERVGIDVDRVWVWVWCGVSWRLQERTVSLALNLMRPQGSTLIARFWLPVADRSRVASALESVTVQWKQHSAR